MDNCFVKVLHHLHNDSLWGRNLKKNIATCEIIKYKFGTQPINKMS